MEIVDAIEQGRESIVAAMAAITLYLSLVTAYLVAVYKVGKNMSNLQAGIITALFVSFAMFFVLGTCSFFISAHDIYTNNELSPPILDAISYGYWLGTTQLVGIIAALLFMHRALKGDADT